MKVEGLTTVSNKIVLSRSNFSVPQRKILVAIISVISPVLNGVLTENKNHLPLNLTSGNFQEIEYKASALSLPGNYDELRKALEELCTRGVFIETDEIHFGSTLIAEYEFNKSTEYIKLHVSKKLYSILLDLTQGYTIYQTQVLLSFSSIYAMRMYEIIAKWRNKPKFYVSLEELRYLTDTQNKYANTKDFKKRVLDAAKSQLDASDITDLKFDYAERKKGKKVLGFDIFIQKTKHAHDIIENKVQGVSLRWDFSKDMIANFEKFGLVGLKGKNLETIKALKTLLGEKKLAAEIERIYIHASEKTNAMGYIIASLKNALLGLKTEPADMTPEERRKHAETVRNGEPQQLGDLFKSFKK